MISELESEARRQLANKLSSWPMASPATVHVDRNHGFCNCAVANQTGAICSSLVASCNSTRSLLSLNNSTEVEAGVAVFSPIVCWYCICRWQARKF